MCSYNDFIDWTRQSIATCSHGTIQRGKNKGQEIRNAEKIQTDCSSIDEKIQNNLQKQQQPFSDRWKVCIMEGTKEIL